MRTATTILALAGVGTSSMAQWSTIDHDPTEPVVAGASLVLHDNGSAFHAFSAMSRRWTAVASTGSDLEGVGDWTALVRDTSGAYVAYSARLESKASAPIPLGYSVTGDPHIGAELVFLTATAPGGTSHVHLAWSAQTNEWSAAPTKEAASWLATEQLAALADASSTAHAYSARSGRWTSAVVATGGDPLVLADAEGNVAAWWYLDSDGGVRALAFSAVLGSFSASPQIHSSWSADILVGHDLAFVGAHVEQEHFAASVFNAYDGAWRTSSLEHETSSTTVTVSGRTVLLRDTGSNPGWEAIGVRPASFFTTAEVDYELVAQGRDWIVLQQPGGELLGFSGVCGGAFVPEPAASTLAEKVVQDTSFGAVDGAQVAHVFSAVRAAWAPPLAPGSPGLQLSGYAMDGIIALPFGLSEQYRFGFSPLFGDWVASPEVDSSGQSCHFFKFPGAAGAVDWWIWDVQRNAWFDVPQDHAVPFDACTDSLSLLYLIPPFGGDFFDVYSLRRGDYISAPSLPIDAAADIGWRGNVVYYSDPATLHLHAYSALDREHAWFDYPTGTEFQFFPSTSAVTPYFASVSVLGEPGDVAFWILSTSMLGAPISLPGIANPLWLDPGSPHLLMGPIDLGADGLGEFHQPLPPGSPTCFRGWTQAVLVSREGILSLTPGRPEGLLVY